MRQHNIHSVAKVYEQFVVDDIDGAPAESTFRGWVKSGTKYAVIAGAGESCLLTISFS
jgi:hypothetical protein